MYGSEVEMMTNGGNITDTSYNDAFKINEPSTDPILTHIDNKYDTNA
jgi:hypothetical protein